MTKASPQIYNGYLKIAHELFEAMIMSNIPFNHRKVLDTIIRYTYGYNKKSNHISMENFRVLTGLRAQNICRCIKELERAKVIVVIHKDKIVEYGINKNYYEWLCYRSLYNWRSVIQVDKLSRGIIIPEDNKCIHVDNDFIPVDNNFIPEDNNSVASTNDSNGLQPLNTTLNKTLNKTKDNISCEGTKIKRKKEFREEITEVLNFFNDLTDSKLLVKAQGNRIPIKARLRDGYTVEDCKQVIRTKWEQWGTDDYMYKFVRISTLFCPKHFDAYLNEKGARVDELEGFVKKVAKR